MMNVYFDNAATTQMHPQVLNAMMPYLKGNYGNPSSIHSFGRKVRVALEEARETAAEFIGANPSEIYFVSSGTEANNFPIFGISKTVFKEDGRKHLITSQAEHACVLETFKELEQEGFSTSYISIKENGIIDLNKLLEAITDNTSLVSLIHVNNETGSINPIHELADKINNPNIFIHTDAVQSFGKTSINVQRLGIHALSASAHKIHGPKGVGMVYCKSGTPLSPMIFGGSQERNRRGGTEFAAGIIGFAEAIRLSINNMSNHFDHTKELRDYFIELLSGTAINGITINDKDHASPYVLSLTFDSNIYNNDAEAMLMFLDINGIAASNGAACTSGTLKPSHVITSMGKPKNDAWGTIRFSFSYFNTKEEVEYVVENLGKMAKKFKKKS